MDLFPVWLSLRVSVAATTLTLAAGLPLAWVLARKRFPGHDLLEAAVVLPLVLPPTVLGYYLLVLIGSRGPVGRALGYLGIELAFTWKAAVLAGSVGSIALLVKAAQAGFESVDGRLERAARTLGRSEWSVFWSVTLPLAWRSVFAGTVLSFCRAFGDFGITLMVAGSIPGLTQTLPLAIYDHVQANQMREADLLSLIAVGSVTVLLVSLGRLARLRF
ncbi:MAG TPA: molybdate ABC transporter permease subunit [Candidatus Limnocylindrales bacterium]|nr:molybdate ABC transporter permease subunit [Candidatus Limnocylindrales bacterium]